MENVFGRDHPEVATVLNNLSALYGDEGHFGESRSLLLRSLAIREK